METREEYRESKEAHLKELGRKIDQLRAQAEKPEAELRVEYYEIVEDLKAKEDAAWQILQELKRVENGEPWDHLKSAMEYHWEDLVNAVDKAIG